MDDPTTRPASRRLAVSVALGAVAGFVDAVCFAHLFDVFPANQSGNAILLGIGLGNGSVGEAWPPATAMVGFALGVAGAVALRRTNRLAAPTRALLGVEILLLATVTVVVGSILDVEQPLDGPRLGALLLLATLAMGVQTEVIRSHAGISISTTYQTGALTVVAERLGDARDRGVERRPAPGAPVVLLSILAGYVGGAALGSRLSTDVGSALVVPLVALVVLLLTVPRWDRSDGQARPGTGADH